MGQHPHIIKKRRREKADNTLHPQWSKDQLRIRLADSYEQHRKLEGELFNLKNEFTRKDDAAHSVTLDERDFRVKQIEKIADVLGDDSEWTSANDRGDRALRLAADHVNALTILSKRILGGGPFPDDDALALFEKARAALEKPACTRCREWAPGSNCDRCGGPGTGVDFTRKDAAVDVTVPSIPMLLTCPACSMRHVDKEKANTPHRDHACQFCGTVWRPCKENTIGVKFLPGYKDA